MMAAAATALAAGCSEGSEGGTGGPAECSDYDNEAATEVTVRFTNGSDEVIYLGSERGCGWLDAFELRDEAGAVVPWYVGPCAQTCATVGLDCAADCALPPLVQIAPGGHYDMTWTGLVLAERSDACDDSGEPLDATCQQQVLGAGPYEVTGMVYKAIDGCDPASSEGCACEPTTGEGACLLSYPTAPAGAKSPTQAAAYQQGNAAVELVFQ
ncbi:Hypothetical protein CAP_5169 [Chondromyces apiculatus DSM 436]|uniref:Uncharacterized protein n=1 Tax=Chondromyces apiculatus DSM 436 TaxID=1192034 RepID=A0A017T3B2_9BACT|nr:Hypothetical protein CAP_5169 [Chondromyces apiculatus DSM 436]